MNFLFPLFLISGLAIAIPIIIHLFNFRKFKTVYFSDTRLLREIKISSQKSRTVQNWWLLLSRILFVLALVFAFAQPFLGTKNNSQKVLKIVYLDNSASMADNLGGQRTLLLNAIDLAKEFVNNQGQDQQFILLSNNNIYASRPIGKTQILDALSHLRISAKTVSLEQINEATNNAISDNNASAADVFFFSDLQKSTLFQEQIKNTNKKVCYTFKPLEHKSSANLYIDTAYFPSPVLDTRQANTLIVKVAKSNSQETLESQVQVWVNGQVRAAKNVAFSNDSLWSDSIPLNITTPGWHQIEITVKDAPIQFDDTFRISAKTNANLSVLMLSDGVNSPYLQAAFGPSNGFITRQNSLNTGSEKDWSNYNLIVLQSVNTLPPELSKAIKTGLQNGLSFLLIPGNISNINSFNESLNNIAPITFSPLDTSRQQVGSIQTEHALLKDVIAAMPANVQLPTVLKHYPISAGLSAGEQSILSLKNGKPLLAQFNIDQGKLYLMANELNEQSGNFVLSNLFMPIMYKMCALSGAQSIYAVNANSQQAIFVPGQSSNRTVFKAFGLGAEVIPPQNAYGNGTNVYLGKVIQNAGFYTLKNESVKDSAIIAVNSNRLESKLEAANEDELSSSLQPAQVNWINTNQNIESNRTSATDIWKWLAGIALLALIMETYFLLKKNNAKKMQA